MFIKLVYKDTRTISDIIVCNNKVRKKNNKKV